MTTIADRVREARLAAGMSQTALAGDAFSPSYLSLIESGRREPTDAVLAVIAARVGSTVDYLRHGADAPSEARVRLGLDYARLDLTTGDAAAALDRLENLGTDGVTAALRHEVQLATAQAHELIGELEQSVAILEPLLDEARAAEHLLDAATVAMLLVADYLEAGDLHRAIEVGERTLDEVESAGLIGTDEHLRLASTLLWAYVERGDLLYATHRAAELVREADAHGTPRGRGSVYWNAALVAERRGDYELARRCTQRALALLGEGDPGRDIPRLHLNYAWLLLRSEPPEPAAALEQLDLALPGLVAGGSEVELARVDVERSRATLLVGDPAGARRSASEAIDRLGDAPRLETCTALLALGDAQYAQGDVAGSAESYRAAADMLGMMSASRQSAAAWRELGDRFLGRGDVSQAAEAFDRALREAGFRPSVPAALGEAWARRPVVY